MMAYIRRIACIALFAVCVTSAQNVVELNAQNFETITKNTDVLLVNFFAKWCKFSRMLEPVFEQTAKAVSEKHTDSSRVKLGKVDCEAQIDIAKKFGINKYPTIKMFKNGKMAKREYRGQRSVEGMTEFVSKQLESPIVEIKNLDDIQDLLDGKKQNMIGYFTSKEVNEFKQFDKVAGMLRDDCGWFAAFGDVSAPQRPGGGFQIVFKPPNVEHGEKLYSQNLKSHEMFLAWATDKCIPLVRTITFENAEELTEEGIPFLILFHHPDDTESPRKFTEVVQKSLITQKETITFLTADGVQFAHPLHHMGKSVKDLPVLAIDSFKHMYVFPDKNKMFDAPELLKFIQDLHSGKLHREFHHGPDPTTPPQLSNKAATGAETKKPAATEKIKQVPQTPDTPPESQFAKLKPSEMRYSFSHKDEL